MSTQARSIGKVRYSIVAMLFLATMINYADRATLAITASSMSKDLGITPLQLGIVFSAFGWAYVIAQVPGGWLLDRFGSKRVYMFSIIIWSLLTAAQGGVAFFAGTGAIVLLFVLRFLVGLAEAPAMPGNARIVSAWFPASERGTASAIFNSAQYFATVVFAPLMGWITYAFGWGSVFLVMGGVGLGVAVIWAFVVHPPSAHPRLATAELDHIVSGGGMADLDRKAETTGTKKARRPIGFLLRSRSLWGLYIGQFCINTLTYFFISWFPVYLVQERGMSVLNAGIFASAPAICGFLGGILGGVWSDWLLRRGNSLTVARKVPIVVGMIISTSIILCNWVDSPWAVLVFMSAAFFGKGVGALGWAVMSDIAPREMTGISSGLFNTFGNLSSILTPIVIGAVVQHTGSFRIALLFVAGNALAAAASFLFMVGRIERLELPGGSADPVSRTSDLIR